MTPLRASRPFAALVAFAAALATFAVGAAPASAETLPTGFTDTLVASVSAPTSFAFTPDGRTLVTEQGGALAVIVGGAVRPHPAIDLTSVICSDSERGLLGVAVDPSFAANHFIYLDYTHRSRQGCPLDSAGSPTNRVSRFVLGDDSHVVAHSETVLVDGMPSPHGNHNGGDLKFGHDGNLYVTIGDGGCDYAGDSGCGGGNDASRDQFTLTGKVLRITPTGGIPADNPFQTATDDRCNVTGHTIAGHRCQETYAWGLRNPFRLAFDPNQAGTVFRIDDVGQDVWEEVDDGIAGADYGWNVREGHCANGSTTHCGPPPAGMTNPIYDYAHSTGCAAITGAAYVPDGAWSANYDDHYLYADYICNRIFDLVPNTHGGFKAKTFASSLGGGGPVAMAFGPDGPGQSLYYTTYGSGGQLRVIRQAP